MSRTKSLGYHWPSLIYVPAVELDIGLELLLNGETPRLSRNTITVIKQLFSSAVDFADQIKEGKYKEGYDIDARNFLYKALRFGEPDKYPRNTMRESDKRLEEDIRRLERVTRILPDVDKNIPREEYTFLKDTLKKIQWYSQYEEEKRRFE